MPDFDWLVLVGLHIEGKRRMSFLCGGDTPREGTSSPTIFVSVNDSEFSP